MKTFLVWLVVSLLMSGALMVLAGPWTLEKGAAFFLGCCSGPLVDSAMAISKAFKGAKS